MPAHTIRIPGVILSGELDPRTHGSEFRALCGDRVCVVRFPPECAQADREKVFRAFRTEVMALARARHSTIPAVFEMGTVDDRPYAVVELPEGETLAERLRWGPLSESAIVALGTRLLGGLRDVHRRGLLHGNLTPARIVFVHGDADVRIIGFGSAPPAAEKRETVHGGGDLASLGRVLYECATGRAAFAELVDDPRRDWTELPELSGGNEPLTSAELSALIARLIRCGTDPKSADADSIQTAFDRLEAGSPGRASLPGFAREGTVLVAHEEVPVVAREPHLRMLRETWSDVQTGAGAIVHVRGAAGSGKTRLVETFLRSLSSDPALVLKARCVSGDSRPYAALGELLNEHARGASDAEPTQVPHPKSALWDAAQDMAPLLKQLSPELARLFGGASELGSPHELQALFAEGVAEFLTRLLKSAGKAVVWIDDLQWMDASSRAVLTRAVDRARGSSTLFIVSSRTDPQGTAEAEAFFRPIRSLRHVEFTLRPFEADECRQLVEGYLGTPGVPAEVTGPLIALHDGTPMSVLELLHALGAEGLLVPFWGNWRLSREGIDRMKFPTHTREILARRVSELSASARQVISAAAVLGSSFDETLLASVVRTAEYATALQEARDARVLVRADAGDCRFVHETVREVLFEQLGEERVRAIQQRIAETLDAVGGSDTPSVCRRASAYAAGNREIAPHRVYATNYEAGLRTFASFDNDRALSFLTVAEEAAHQAHVDPDAQFFQTLGDVHVRRGALSKGRQCFEAALTRVVDPIQRGLLESRVAWVMYTSGDLDDAWQALRRAFAALSHEMPSVRPTALARQILSWRTVRREWNRAHVAKILRPTERVRLETLCAFHYQAARLALENDQPAPFLAHVLAGIELAERLGPSRALVRTLLFYGLAQVIVGLRSAGLERLEAAERMADAIRDPVVSAYCLQIRCVIMGWAGEIELALEAGNRLLLERGHWLELSEYCLLCWNQSLMLGLRGQAEAAWQWIERGIEKVRHEPHAAEISFLEPAARAALATLGREAEFERYYEGGRLMPREPSTGRGSHHRFAFGVRVREYTERGIFGPEFEALVAQVRATVQDPRWAHVALSEFYVHLAHARVHQCLRAETTDRGPLLEALAESLKELRAVARIRVLTAHLWVIEAYQALFLGSFAGAALAFARADDLAQRDNCPWVLFAVARGRAHWHKAQGRAEPAHAQAALAAKIADMQGYAHRLRWIEEEFPALATASVPSGLRAPVKDVIREAGGGGGSRSVPLLQIGSPNDLNLTEQAKRIIAELLEAVRADRGIVFLSPETGGPPSLVAGRDAYGKDAVPANDHTDNLVRRAFQTGRPIAEDVPSLPGDSSPVITAVASPLAVGERVIGAIYLEKSRDRLTGEDVHVLELLANQAAVIMELTRALRGYGEELRGRKLLEDELRQAQKMEAIGRLAGTIAHDFNNLLAIITATLDCVQMEHGPLLAGELGDIREACDRAASLTGQLLTFARRQPSTPAIVQLNTLLGSSVPLIRRLVPDNIEVVTRLESERDTLLAEPTRVEQVLLNLAANARDAMPDGGRLTITTADTRALAGSGDDAEDSLLLAVEDTGEGMSPEVLRQAFEPFFTTKSPGKGTGLGLATVYGIVQQMHGRIAVESTPGRGTTFFMYFPRATAAIGMASDLSQGTPTSGRPHSQVARRPETILLVDDERLILTALERGLIREGYRVIPALSGEQAVQTIQAGAPRIDAVVTDVLMPRMNGPELVERLRGLGLRVPHLFMSGFTDEALVSEHLHDEGGLLVKPFPIGTLVERIRLVLDNRPSAFERGA